MKFTIEATALKRGAVRIARVADPRSAVPILRNAMIRAGDGAVEISGANSEYAARIRLPAAIEEAGAACVDAADLKAFADIAEAGSQISVKLVESLLSLSAGRRRARLRTLPQEDFPQPMDPADPADIDTAALAKAFRFCAVAASREEARYYLRGVALDGDFAVATNNQILHAWRIKTGIATIIPLDHIPLMVDVLVDDGAAFGADETKWGVTTTDTILVGRCLDGKFPDWRRVVPKSARVAIAHRSSVADACDTATLRHGGVVKMSGAKGADMVEVKSAREMGDGAAECDAEVLADFKAALDMKNVTAALSVLPDRDLTIEKSDAAIRLAPMQPEDGEFSLIMEVRG